MLLPAGCPVNRLPVPDQVSRLPFRAASFGNGSLTAPAHRRRAGRGDAVPFPMTPQMGAGDGPGQDAQPWRTPHAATASPLHQWMTYSTSLIHSRRARNSLLAVPWGQKNLIPSPAGDGAVPFHPAGVYAPGADGNELPGRRRGFAIPVLAPTFDRSICPHTAGVPAPGADGGELPLR